MPVAPPSAAWRRDYLLILLTLTTGSLDATAFLRLGNVFSSVITGNLALLGVAAGRADPALALSGGLALAGYAAGVLAGAAIAGTPQPGQPTWPAPVTRTLAAELAPLLAFSALWLVTGPHPADGSRVALLLLAAAAMGIQSTAVRRLGQFSTTYLTSTLTGVISALAIRGRPPGWPRSVGILVAFAAGAALASLVVTRSPSWLPAAALIPFLTVLIAAAAGAASEPPSDPA